MTRFSALFALVTFISGLAFSQADWQGDVKKLYPITVPAYQGNVPVFGLAKKTATLPDIELYSLSLKLGNLKTSVDFYRASLEKQGFKPVKTTSFPTMEKVEMLNATRKLSAVVVASKQTAQTMLLGVTVMPQGTVPR